VTFLDFGLVKHWSKGELESLYGPLDAILDGDAPLTVQRAIEAGFLAPDHGLDPDFVYAYVKGPYEPFLAERFTYTREWTSQALQAVIDLQGRYSEVIRKLNMPPSYVILDRVLWGVSALMGHLHATNNFRGILGEYREGGPPVTELGRVEAEWRATQPATPTR
jgi:hypothetical protein